MTAKEFADLVSAFENHSLPKSGWTHNAHLAIGFYYAAEYPGEDAMVRLRKDISSYNLSTNTPNTDTDGYHDSITWFWLQTIRKYLTNREGELPGIYIDFLNTEISKQEFIFNYYSRDHLFTVEARRNIVLPDLKNIED